MPCYCEDPPPIKSEKEKMQERLGYEEYYAKYYRKQADKVTRMLCSIGKRLRKKGLLSVLTPRQLNWIEKHEDFDRLCKENKRNA